MGTLDFRAAEFREPHKVDQELRRVYDICAGCRRCLPLCPSFKVLFDRLEVDAVDRDVEKLPAADVKEVVALCYHRWEVDFPRLMLRARAAQTRAGRVSPQDRVLGNTELVGKLGSLTAPLSNWMNEVSVHPRVHAGRSRHSQGPQSPALSAADLLHLVSQAPADPRAGASGGPLRHLSGRVSPARGGPRRRPRAREERSGGDPAHPAMLRHAVPGRRGGGRGACPRPGQRALAGRVGSPGV